MIKNEIFSIPIWQTSLKINDKILLNLFEASKKFNYIRKASCEGDSEQTKDISNLKEFSYTKKTIEDNFLKETNNKVSLINSWICKNNYGSFNKLHVHGGCDISGVYYINCPKNSGNIIFRNPIESVHILDKNLEKDNLWIQQWEVASINKKIIYFPSFLPHYTQINNSKEPRLALSFNLVYI